MYMPALLNYCTYISEYVQVVSIVVAGEPGSGHSSGAIRLRKAGRLLRGCARNQSSTYILRAYYPAEQVGGNTRAKTFQPHAQQVVVFLSTFEAQHTYERLPCP